VKLPLSPQPRVAGTVDGVSGGFGAHQVAVTVVKKPRDKETVLVPERLEDGRV
jgi:hypothetical protein